MQQGHNIGEDGVHFRLFFGVLLIFFSLGLTLLLAVMGTPLPLRAAIFLPMWQGILCLVQARYGVCVLLAGKGTCVVDGGTAPIQDPAIRQSIEKRGVRIHLISMASACVLTVMLMLASLYIPWRSFFAE